MTTDTPLRQRFSTVYAYDIYFTHRAFAGDNETVRTIYRMMPEVTGPVRTLVCIDEGLLAARPACMDEIVSYCRHSPTLIDLACEPLILPGGEAAKNGFAVPERVIRGALDAHLCRHSAIWVVGGGAVQDAAGLGVSLFHRGARLFRFPSTVLSQNDSGVGVKNGVNVLGVKNLAGVFSPPWVVVNDLSLLSTLSDRDWCAGIPEAFKVACIRDRDFLHWLISRASELKKRDRSAMERLVPRCAALHADHIVQSGDPFELGSSRPLDFGHWAAHKLETMTGYQLRHGEAVAIGLSIDLLYAGLKGFVTEEEADVVIGALAASGVPVWHEALATKDRTGRYVVLDGIEEFREHLGGVLHVTFPGPIGNRLEVTSIDEPLMVQAIDLLGSRVTG